MCWAFFVAGNVMAEMERPNYAQLKLGVFQPTGDLDDADYRYRLSDFREPMAAISPISGVRGVGSTDLPRKTIVDGSNDIAGSYDQEIPFPSQLFW